MEGTGRAEGSPGTLHFYHRAVAPMMWVLFTLICLETAVIHGLVALWSGKLALLLSLFSLATLIWLGLFIRSLARCPVRLDADRLVWRCGSLRSLCVPVEAIAGFRSEWDRTLLKSRSSFNAALIAYPNIMIVLDPPVAMGRREIHRLAHRLDDPQAFVAALDVILRRT